MKIIIPFKTPSVNHLYIKGRILKLEARQIREQISLICKDLSSEGLKNKNLKVVTKIHEDWLTLDGKVKRKDIANREKFLIDSVFNALQLDDKYIQFHAMIKEQNKEKEYSEIEITEL